MAGRLRQPASVALVMAPPPRRKRPISEDAAMAPLAACPRRHNTPEVGHKDAAVRLPIGLRPLPTGLATAALGGDRCTPATRLRLITLLSVAETTAIAVLRPPPLLARRPIRLAGPKQHSLRVTKLALVPPFGYRLQFY